MEISEWEESRWRLREGGEGGVGGQTVLIDVGVGEVVEDDGTMIGMRRLACARWTCRPTTGPRLLWLRQHCPWLGARPCC